MELLYIIDVYAVGTKLQFQDRKAENVAKDTLKICGVHGVRQMRSLRKLEYGKGENICCLLLLW